MPLAPKSCHHHYENFPNTLILYATSIFAKAYIFVLSHHRNLPISEVSSLASSLDSLDSVTSEDEPLLTRTPLSRGLSTLSEGHDRTGTIFSSIFTLVSTMIGGGLLSLPFAFQQGGYAVSSLVLIFVLAASTHGGFLVINSKKYCHGKIRNIEDVARVAFGKKGQVSRRPFHMVTVNSSDSILRADTKCFSSSTCQFAGHQPETKCT